jgi:hypothetical protein
VEAPLEPSGSINLAIGPIREIPSGDRKVVFIEGTVENVGTRPTRTITVWVNSLDELGMIVERVEALPTPQDVPPGTVSRYVVTLSDDPRVRTYHVEAIGR